MYKKFGKRFFDIFLSTAAMLILSPPMVFISLLIKITDPGSIIFKQSRIGRGGQEFEFYKFRSMPVNTGDVSSDKVGDVRIGRVGKFIRRTSIDELPQLFNILLGDMSIVGPRPAIPSQTELINLRKNNNSIQCLPGLTGYAQINSFNGMSVKEKADLDEEYANSISLINDLKIIIRTFSYLSKPPPVY